MLKPFSKIGTIECLNYRQDHDTPADLRKTAEVLQRHIASTGHPWDRTQAIYARPTPDGVDDSLAMRELFAGDGISRSPIGDGKPINIRQAVVQARVTLLDALRSAATNQTTANPETVLRAELYSRAFCTEETEDMVQGYYLRREEAFANSDKVDTSLIDYGTIIAPEEQTITGNRRTSIRQYDSVATEKTPSNSVYRVTLLESVIMHALSIANEHTSKDAKPDDILRLALPIVRYTDLRVAVVTTVPKDYAAYLDIQMRENGAAVEGRKEVSEADTLRAAWQRWSKLDIYTRGKSYTACFPALKAGTAQVVHPICYLQDRYRAIPIIRRLTDSRATDYAKLATSSHRDAWQSLRFREIGGEDLKGHNKTRTDKKLPPVDALNANPAPIVAFLDSGVYDTATPTRAMARADIASAAAATSGDMQRILQAVATNDKNSLADAVTGIEIFMQSLRRIPAECRDDFAKTVLTPAVDGYCDKLAPAAEAPAADAPTADAPTADAPTADAPAADAPTADAPTADAPTAEAPAAEAPAAEAPAAEAPAERKGRAKGTPAKSQQR